MASHWGASTTTTTNHNTGNNKSVYMYLFSACTSNRYTLTQIKFRTQLEEMHPLAQAVPLKHGRCKNVRLANHLLPLHSISPATSPRELYPRKKNEKKEVIQSPRSHEKRSCLPPSTVGPLSECKFSVHGAARGGGSHRDSVRPG